VEMDEKSKKNKKNTLGECSICKGDGKTQEHGTKEKKLSWENEAYQTTVKVK